MVINKSITILNMEHINITSLSFVKIMLTYLQFNFSYKRPVAIDEAEGVVAVESGR